MLLPFPPFLRELAYDTLEWASLFQFYRILLSFNRRIIRCSDTSKLEEIMKREEKCDTLGNSFRNPPVSPQAQTIMGQSHHAAEMRDCRRRKRRGQRQPANIRKEWVNTAVSVCERRIRQWTLQERDGMKMRVCFRRVCHVWRVRASNIRCVCSTFSCPSSSPLLTRSLSSSHDDGEASSRIPFSSQPPSIISFLSLPLITLWTYTHTGTQTQSCNRSISVPVSWAQTHIVRAEWRIEKDGLLIQVGDNMRKWGEGEGKCEVLDSHSLLLLAQTLECCHYRLSHRSMSLSARIQI